MENNYYKSNNRFWTGIFLIIGGGLLLAHKMGAPIPYWIFSWPVFLIALGLLIGIKHQFQNTSWIILMGIGSFFLLEEQVADLNLHQYIWPVVIIAAGLLFILSPKRKSRRFRNRWNNYDNSTSPESQSETIITDGGEDTLYINSVFSGVKRTILSKNFKGGEINCVFGGVEIDLSQADFEGIATIKLEEVFGGMKLVIPQNWNVRNEIEGIFHGVEDKRRFQTTTDTNKTLVLKGSAVFAGIEIKSY